MKLFTRYSRINLIVTTSVFVLSGLAYFFIIRFILIEQVDDDLQIEETEIRNSIDKYGKLPEGIEVRDQEIRSRPVAEVMERLFKMFNKNEEAGKKAEPYRRLVFTVKAKDQLYQVDV